MISAMDDIQAMLPFIFQGPQTPLKDRHALTGTAQAATSTIGTAGTTIAALQPLVGHVDSAVTSLDTSLQTTSLDLDAVLQHTEAITSSAAKVSDHFEKMIDAPKKHTFWGDVKAGWQIIWQVAMLAK